MNLLIAENPLMVLPKLAERIGLEESIFIQQIHYLTLHSRNVKGGKRWVYNTYTDWLKIFPFLKNEQKVQRVVTKLEEIGLLITQKDPIPMNRRKWYRVNYASDFLNIEDSDLNDEDSDLNDEDSDLNDEDSDLNDEDSDLNDEDSDLIPAINRDFQQRLSTNINHYVVATTAEAADAPPLELEPVADKPPMTAKPKRNTPNPANAETWQAYRAAYLQAYGVEPLRNAKVNGQIANFVKMVGEDKAPHIAAFYVSHPNQWYRTKGHDFGTLLANAQALATDWQRNTRTTSVQTRQQEKTAANMESHKGAIEILKAKGLM